MKMPSIFFVICLGMLEMGGCSTVSVPVVVRHPAEADLFNYKQIAIGTFHGDLGEKFYERIKQELVESPSRFRVLDRSMLNQILSELRLSQSDLVDARYRAKAGKLLGATALITGGMSKKYSETYQSFKSKCSNRDRRDYDCWSNSRTGVLRTSGSADVIDLQTGQILKSKVLSDTCSTTNSAVDSSPAYIDVGALTERCLQNQVNNIMRTVSIWTEVISAPFEKDSDIPEMDRGIAYAKAGDLSEAAQIFASAARASEGSRSVDAEGIANAYWNAGLAYLYLDEFENSIAAFNRAFVFSPNEKYLQQRHRAEYLKIEKQKLNGQLSRNR